MSLSTLIDAESLATLLQQNQPNVLIVDCRYALTDPLAGRQAYAEGHIPGAVYADLGELMSGPATGMNGRHPLPDPQVFADGMADFGAHNDTLIIAYDAGDSMFAARLWWLLRWIGHEKVRVLDGGLQAWTAAGASLSADVPQRQRGTLGLRHRAMPTVTFSDMFANVESQERPVLDARSPDRFRGENESIDPVGGHIPGARNRFFKNNVNADGTFKPAAQLREEFEALLGDTPSEHLVHQCGSGVSACHNLLAMDIAGLKNGPLYPGSWSEWCRQPDAPVARGADPA